MAIESPLAVSLQDIANVATFIVPGYFAIAIYAIKYAKSERNTSKLIIESIAWSLPLIAINNYIWEKLLHNQPVASLDKEYAVILLGLAIASGFIVAELRLKWPIKQLASKLGVDSPDEDFVRTHFARLNPGDPVTVKLKSDSTFSGTPASGSIYSKDGPRKYCFKYVAWYDEDKDKWDETDDTIMVDLREIEYILSPQKRQDTERKRRKLPSLENYIQLGRKSSSVKKQK